MREIVPSNEAYLAVELWAACNGKLGAQRMLPGRVARIAAELCALGRAYRNLSTRLCGGQEEWGPHPEGQVRYERALERRARVREKAVELIKPWGAGRAWIDTSSGMLLHVHTKSGGYPHDTVAL